MTELISIELIASLFNIVVPPACIMGLMFGIAQFLFSSFMKLAFGNKTYEL